MCKDFYEDCPSYLRAYLSYVSVVKARTERTVEAYYGDIRVFLRYLKITNLKLSINEQQFEKLKIEDIPFEWIRDFTIKDAYVYLSYLSNVRKNSPCARARKVSSLKQFYDYLHKRALMLERNPVDLLEVPKIPQRLPRYLTANQSLTLLNNVESRNQERDLCMLLLFLSCGMRLSELVGLNVIDYCKEKKSLRLFGKGEKERIVYLNPPCVEALELYLSIRPQVSVSALFLSQKNQRINKRRVQQIVEDQLKKAGLDDLGITTHKLRHTAATLMYESGVDTLVLKELLGHKSVATTELYTHISDTRLKDAAITTPIASFTVPHSK